MGIRRKCLMGMPFFMAGFHFGDFFKTLMASLVNSGQAFVSLMTSKLLREPSNATINFSSTSPLIPADSHRGGYLKFSAMNL